MTKLANALGENLRSEKPNLVGQDFLDELDKELRTEFPEKFGKKKGVVSMVESGSGRGPGLTGKQSYGNLPDDAKKACDRYIKAGTIKTREEYCSMYDWS